MRKLAQPALLEALRGMHSWLQQQQPEVGEEINAASTEPTRKVLRVAQREAARGSTRQVQRGRPGEASPATVKRTWRGGVG